MFVCVCFSINVITISAEGLFKWTSFSNIPPKSVSKSLVRPTCYIFHPTLPSLKKKFCELWKSFGFSLFKLHPSSFMTSQEGPNTNI